MIWTEGCIQKFEDYMRKELYTVAGVFIGVALVQVSSSSDLDQSQLGQSQTQNHKYENSDCSYMLRSEYDF